MKILKMMDSDRGHSDRLYISLRRFCLSLQRRDLLPSLDEVAVKDTACKESSHTRLQVSERERETEEDLSLSGSLFYLSAATTTHREREGRRLSARGWRSGPCGGGGQQLEVALCDQSVDLGSE